MAQLPWSPRLDPRHLCVPRHYCLLKGSPGSIAVLLSPFARNFAAQNAATPSESEFVTNASGPKSIEILCNPR